MEIDPHTIQAILQKIHQQMRCPQCGKRVPVDLSSLQVLADDVLVLQVYCADCSAHIVLQATMQGAEHLSAPGYKQQPLHNASTTMQVDKSDLDQLRAGLAQAGGSFEELFKETEKQIEAEGESEIV